VLQVDEAVLELRFEVRELYVKGGAVPGDSVIYRATLPKDWHQLSVQIKEPLKQLAVTTTVDNVDKPTFLLMDERPLVVHEVSTPSPSPRAASRSSAQPSILSLGIDYVWIGIVHIVPLGWDHILFVIALTLGSFGKWRRLVVELSAFTAAHTLTLALGALELVRVSPSIVEPLIALSIAAVALEHLLGLEKRSLRYSLVGGFGLLHGLGFAGVLLELGFSKGSFLLFLVSFNIGVELGQLLVVGLTLVALLLLAPWPEKRALGAKGITLAIAACGLVVFALRLAG
jgi:hypothetical protein